MTDLRLEQLREEFEEARLAHIEAYQKAVSEHVKLSGGHMPFRAFDQLSFMKASGPDEYANEKLKKRKNGTLKPPVVAARRYIIARDFGEFREGHWQKLWKLREGGAA